MRAYRVTFEQSHVKYTCPGWVDLFAANAKDACAQVLELCYYSKGHKVGFYPYHRHATRINPDAMCHGIRWGDPEKLGVAK